MKSSDKKIASTKIGWIISITSALGLFASFALSIEEIIHLKHPSAALNCDLNPLIGCGSILDTWQGHVLLNIPNQFFGLIAFSVMLTLGILIISKVSLPKWMWSGLQLGALAGVITVFWFLYQSLFVLSHLCPYCMLTWASTLVASWYITVRNLSDRSWKFLAPSSKLPDFVVNHHLDIIITVFVFIVLGIIFRFREFFFG